VLKWFFPDGLRCLLPRVAAAYHDDAVTADVLRCSYLTAEPLAGACVAECLFPLENGLRVPVEYMDRFLRERMGGEAPARTCKRIRANLRLLGFLGTCKSLRNRFGKAFGRSPRS
jgi:hypothetical protein